MWDEGEEMKGMECKISIVSVAVAVGGRGSEETERTLHKPWMKK